MTQHDIAAVMAGIGLPTAYYQFTEDTAQPPPFICFYISGSNDFTADNKNYRAIRELVVELYTDEKDYALEARVESALQSAGIVYQSVETYIESERMMMVAYTADILFEFEEE